MKSLRQKTYVLVNLEMDSVGMVLEEIDQGRDESG